MRRTVGIGQVCQLSQQCLYIVPLGVHALGGMSAAEIRGTNGGTQCLDVAAEHDLGPGLKTQVYVVAWGNLLELGGARHIRSIDADEGVANDVGGTSLSQRAVGFDAGEAEVSVEGAAQ
jgi:hypothetical protein